MKSFAELGLSENLLQAISELGFENPMPIQEEVIPYLLQGGRDLVALAQTGTGKTAAFGLPVLHKLQAGSKDTQALILSPTRELCMQIAGDLIDYAKYTSDAHIVAVYGGASIKNQVEMIKRGAQVIVATPGRLLDLVNHGHVDLSTVHTVVMDEADEMLNMGFLDDINAILSSVPETRSTLLFSATMPAEVEEISKKFMTEPHEIVIGNKNESTSSVRHICYTVQAKDKYQTLKRIVDFYPRIYGIIFCRTKVETQDVSDRLIKDGYNVDALHGDLSQQQRDYVMRRFRLHNIQLLVATDVAARGIDVDDLTHIINYTLPDETEVYTHRSGRTGRAGKTGISIVISNLREAKRIREIERTINKTFEVGQIPTGKEICSKQIFNLVDRLENAEANEDDIADILPQVLNRLAWLDKDELVKRMVAMEFSRLIGYYQKNEDFTATEDGKKGPKIKIPGQPWTDFSVFDGKTEEGFVKLYINMGKDDGIGPKNIIGMVNDCVQGKVDIGRIDLFPHFSLMDVVEESADDVIRELCGLKRKGRSINVTVATEAQIARGARYKAGPGSRPAAGSDKRSGSGAGSGAGKRGGSGDSGRRSAAGSEKRSGSGDRGGSGKRGGSGSRAASGSRAGSSDKRGGRVSDNRSASGSRAGGDKRNNSDRRIASGAHRDSGRTKDRTKDRTKERKRR